MPAPTARAASVLWLTRPSGHDIAGQKERVGELLDTGAERRSGCVEHHERY